MLELFYGGASDYGHPTACVTTAAAPIPFYRDVLLRYSQPTPPPKKGEKKGERKEDSGSGPKKPAAAWGREVVLKVPMCCTECQDTIETMLTKLSGVKSVDCDVFKRKVVVKGTAAVVPADVLRTCKKLFKKSTIGE